jgi:hypothetical protein
MVDIYGRSRTKKDKIVDLSKYATLDQLRNELDDLLNITSVDQNEVVIFQDKQGRLKTSNIQLPDVLIRIPTAVTNNIVTFADQGKIQDSGKSVNDYVKKTGDVLSGDIIMSGKKITYLGNPTSDNDATTKKYVDDSNNDQVTAITTINNEIATIRTDFTGHVNTFLSFRRNINRSINEFFGSPPTVDIKLVDINTKLTDIISGIPDIIQKTSLINIPHKQIINIVYVVGSGSGTWTQQNKTIKHTAEVAGMYRLSVFSGVEFNILTTSPLANKLTRTVSVMLDKDSEETFTLESSDRSLYSVNYWWCLEFVTKSS